MLVSSFVKLCLCGGEIMTVSWLNNSHGKKEYLFPISSNKSAREEAHWPDLGHMSIPEPIIVARNGRL